MRWVGWYRRRESEPWTRAVEAPTLEEASRKLTAASKALNLRNTNFILTGGAYPNIGAKQLDRFLDLPAMSVEPAATAPAVDREECA